MTVTQTKPTGNRALWLLRRGQWFEATLKRGNKPHPAGPFKCRQRHGWNGSTQLIEAVDAEGDSWLFLLSKFRLRPVDAKGGQ